MAWREHEQNDGAAPEHGAPLVEDGEETKLLRAIHELGRDRRALFADEPPEPPMHEKRFENRDREQSSDQSRQPAPKQSNCRERDGAENQKALLQKQRSLRFKEREQAVVREQLRQRCRYEHGHTDENPPLGRGAAELG